MPALTSNCKANGKLNAVHRETDREREREGERERLAKSQMRMIQRTHST
jgi:hypothetical protein